MTTKTIPPQPPDDPAILRQRSERRAAQEERVRPALIRANLLRLRADYTEAVAVCADALRQAPESAAAHSLMGDIYEVQGRSEEAAQWFRMALDLAPGNASDREKLERILAQKTILPQLKEEPTEPKDKTLRWFHRMLAPGRTDAISRLILAVCLLIALFIFAGAGLLYLADSSRTPEAGLVAPVSALPPPRVAAPAQTVLDDNFRVFLSRTLPKELTLTTATIDPRTLQGQVEALYTVEQRPEEDALLRENILRAATVVAHATARSEERLRRITIRISLRMGTRPAETVFVGDVEAAAIRDVEPALLAYASQTALFTDKWWAESLRPSVPK